MNCPYCNQYLLEPPPSSCPNCGRALPSGTQPSFGDPRQAEYQTSKGIGDLRTAFLLYTVGIVLSLVPIIGAIGGIIDLVAIIFLVIGWRALGRSSLKERGNYRSTGNWLVYVIIAVIVVVFVGTIVIVGSFVFYITSHPNAIPTTSPTNGLTLSQLPGFSGLFLGIALEIVILLGLIYGVWFKTINSMKRLSQEISQPRLRTAANLFLVQISTSIASLVAIVPVFYFVNLGSLIPSLSSPSTRYAFFGTFYYFTLGGYWTLIGLGAIVGVVIVGLASYFAYTALDSASKQFPPGAATPPPMPPTMTGMQFCPNCGHAVNQSNLYCPACGAKLR